ncbi:hypothetical protein H0H81_001057 [Sphagnurus paluster]|uniref:Uncharacterized protein n=1 Tax=Sphagnurus paluster TaxID=117069 RepID=A0A9P7FP58_9AGAR|nr:hypothetical protein H0H81_001057 [Sphagnurus paluster]
MPPPAQSDLLPPSTEEITSEDVGLCEEVRADAEPEPSFEEAVPYAQTSPDIQSTTVPDDHRATPPLSVLDELPTSPPFVHDGRPSMDHQCNEIGAGSRTHQDHAHQAKEYKALSAQFNNFVLISTFTVGLNTAFLGLAYNIIVPQNGSPTATALTHYDYGQLLGLIATGIHVGIIIVAGRAAGLCFRATGSSESLARIEAGCRDKQSFTVDSFYRYVQYCERLQLIASIMLLGFLLFLSYAMFKHQAFFWVLFAASCVGGFSVFDIGFWKVSASFQAADEISKWLRGRFVEGR